MAKNEGFRDADHLSLPVASGVKSGDPVLIGTGPLHGVAETDRADSTAQPDPLMGPKVNLNPDGYASVWLKGSHWFTVAFAVADIGTPIFITPGGALTLTSTSNVRYGEAISTKSAPSGPLHVRISGN